MVQIQVENFSGPIDLLLDLIEKEELDVTALSLAEVTDQYWKEIETTGTDDPDVLAEFITLGSKLLFIKSCALLPSAKPPEADLDEIDQTAEELAAMLADHKRFKDAIDLFRQLEEEGRRTFARMAPVRNVPLPPGLEGVTLDTLLSAVKKALAETPPESEEEAEAVIHIEPVTVTQKMAEVKGKLAGGAKLRFRPLLAECKTRTEIVVLFLAILEMIKGGELWAEQDTPFGDIELVESEPAEAQRPETADAASR